MTRSPELIRGEMRLWTDLSPEALRPAPRGRVLTTFLGRVLGDTADVLVVGPHDPALLAQLAGQGRDLTVVLRSVADAEAVQSAVPGARVVCGGLDAFTDEPHAAVLALDGVERVLSNDSPELDHRARLDLVRSFVADGGILICSVDNPRSLLSLADARPVAERRDSGDWEPPAETDGTRFASLEAAAEVLGGTAYAAFPLVTAPAALTLTGRGVAGELPIRTAIADSAAALAGREFLFDPEAELDRSLDHADVVAPGWIFVSGADVVGDAVFEDHPTRAQSLVRVLDAGSLSVESVPADEPPVDAFAGESLPQGSAEESEPAAVEPAAPVAITRAEPGSALITGELLLDQLRLMSLTEDLPALRRVMGDYLSWVREQADPARAVFATAGNVAMRDGVVAPVDDTYALQAAPTSDVALGRVALDTARHLLDLRLRRIWPPWMGVPELARALAAMAEVELDDETWAEASALDESLAHTRGTVLDEDVRSLRTLIGELRHELWSARGEVFAHERIAALRDKQLEVRSNQVSELQRRTAEAEAAIDSDAVHVVSLTRGSKAYKAARAVRHPGMAVRWVRDRRKN